ncbi:hypothetical protein C0W35_06045 [Photobacterium kishitanii]|uniref:hypothetical protein n=1 Tax=Photobacterium kishitanii TaxID=318456 RepID=UPI00055F412B|nr:hypothetical protein [Photobacterium kishitanii]PSU95579.1 hypothetical protein C0W35_06045 [Photobacterium kishitanii]CEO41733.1 conserved exported hypothetical protein [Photobacterium kishitanii]
MNKKIIILLLLMLALSGWITTAVQIYLVSENKALLLDKILDNPFNLVSLQLQVERDIKDPVEIIKFWVKNGWTAETGSLLTICNNNKEKLSSILSNAQINDACRLVNTGV